MPLVLLSLLRVGPEKRNIKMKRSSSIVIFSRFTDDNISTSYFPKKKKKKSYIFSPTFCILCLLKEEWLITGKSEQGVALLSLDVEVISQWCSPEESHISHWSGFSHTTCSQHRCYYSSYKIISALTLVSVGIYSSACSVSLIENDKNSNARVQQKREKMSGLWKKMRSSCTDSFKPDCLILIAVQPTKLLF